MAMSIVGVWIGWDLLHLWKGLTLKKLGGKASSRFLKSLRLKSFILGNEFSGSLPPLSIRTAQVSRLRGFRV